MSIVVAGATFGHPLGRHAIGMTASIWPRSAGTGSQAVSRCNAASGSPLAAAGFEKQVPMDGRDAFRAAKGTVERLRHT